MQTLIRRLFVVAFLLLLLLPGLQMLTHAVPETAVEENRRLAAWPGSLWAAHAARQANDWFSDHFGLRSLLIRAKAQLDYDVFGVSDKVWVGQDGYLFYRSTLDFEKPAMERLLAAHGADALEGIARYTKALHAQGIGTLFVVNRLGDHFLPDKLPAIVARRPPLVQMDRFVTALRAIPDITFIDSEAILRRTALSRPIFHRTDFHWNDPAAFEVAHVMVDAMAAAEGLRPSPFKHPLEIETRVMSGGVANFMPLLSPPSERTLFVRPNWAWPPGFQDKTDEPPYDDVTRTTPGTAGLLSTALLVGDSFLDGMMRSGLSACFSASYRLRWKPGLTLEAITRALPAQARWVVIEFIDVSQQGVGAFADPADVSRAIALLEARAR